MADYYRKTVNNTANDVKLNMQMAAFTLKLSENNDKIDDLLKTDKDIIKDITDNSNTLKNFYTKQDVLNITSQYYLKKYLYDKSYIDTNFLVKSEIDKKDNEILNKINNNFYSRSYINDNYHLKNNVYDKNYINNLTNELYNRTYLDNKFDDIYNKTETNDKISKLDRNIVLFNQNLTNFIDKNYKKDQKLLDDKISTLENKNLTDVQINKINQLENIDLGKINTSYNYSVYNKNKLDKMTYYIKEFFMHNIDLVRRFNIKSDEDFIQILQFEIDRKFLVNDVIKFYISAKFLYENMKMYWVLYFKMDVHYKDDVLIKTFTKQMTSKGFIFKNLVTFAIDNMFKLNKQTDRLIFKLYMYKVSTAYKNEVTITLSNALEENYCNIIHYSNQ